MSMEILETINNHPEGINVSPKFNRNKITVAKIVTGDKRAYAYLDEGDKRVIQSKSAETRFEPMIAYKGDRNLIYITGPSGAGKSLIAAEFSGQYKALNPDNKVFYCCSTDLKDDRTWGELEFVSPLDVSKFYTMDMEQEDEREMIKTMFSNSLIVFDDLDMLPPAQKKLMTRFQGKVVEVGRKYDISIIIISHIICGGVNTKMVLNETSLYVTFKSMISGNRLLKHYKGFTDDQLQDHKKLTTSYIAYNFRYNTIISPKNIIRIE